MLFLLIKENWWTKCRKLWFWDMISFFLLFFLKMEWHSVFPLSNVFKQISCSLKCCWINVSLLSTVLKCAIDARLWMRCLKLIMAPQYTWITVWILIACDLLFYDVHISTGIKVLSVVIIIHYYFSSSSFDQLYLQ